MYVHSSLILNCEVFIIRIVGAVHQGVKLELFRTDGANVIAFRLIIEYFNMCQKFCHSFNLRKIYWQQAVVNLLCHYLPQW